MLSLTQKIRDEGKGTTHYAYGGEQKDVDIKRIFDAYAQTVEKAFPCHASFNHETRRVEKFFATDSESREMRKGDGKSTFRIYDLGRVESIRQTISKAYGEDVANSFGTAKYFLGVLEVFTTAKEKGNRIDIRAEGLKLSGGFLFLEVVDEGEGKYRVDTWFSRG